MKLRSRDLFATIRTEGGLLPPDLIQRIAQGDAEGLRPEDYHLAEGERINEAVNRAWNRLVGAWAGFRAALEKLAVDDPATTATRERWLLVLFQELGYGRLVAARAMEIDGDSYPISHSWNTVPIHLVGARVDLDRRARGVTGAARMAPHGLLQAFLNRSEHHLWGCVSNGLLLRILRDNASLTRQAYIEFDLEAMMEGEVYADFVILWLLCHQSRVEGDKPSEFWLERWSKAAEQQGTRALDALRDGVQAAIEVLGQGFLAHPANTILRERLRAGALPAQDFYRQLLRLAYRLLFLFVAEDRELIPEPGASPRARERYDRFYSTRRLRRLAERLLGTKHSDMYRAFRLVAEKLDDDAGCPAVGLYCFGSFLWSREALADVHSAELSNRQFLDAVRVLAFSQQGKVLRAVDYKNLGSEELGSVYESLLELHPRLDLDAATFRLDVAAGHERKTTGSYYTPSSLIQCLLDSALEPVLNRAAEEKNPEQAILGLKVCDPACGSGHFLIASAHRIARRLAAVRTGDEEPSPEATRTALRDVIGHCLYGVDLNPMAVELCKVSLWLEALEPGKPLSFLEHRIVLGNSLLGTTPALIAKGIPDGALKPIEGDDSDVVKLLRKQNREERKGQRSLLTEMAAEPHALYETLSESVSRLASGNDVTIATIREKEARLHRLATSPEYQRVRLVADAWCAAFVWRKSKSALAAITEDVFRRLRRDPTSVPAAIREEIARIAEAYRFFHWHLMFPDVFRVPDASGPENDPTGWSGGFDVVLGNPPWERVKLQEKEWFAERNPEIAQARNAAARKRLIAALEQEDPGLLAAFRDALREADGQSQLVRDTDRYPLCGRGDVNTYAIFAELKRTLINHRGRVGMILPTGIATDDTTKLFFQDLTEKEALSSLFDFQSGPGLFAEVGHARFKFCLLTMTGPQDPQRHGAEFAFFLRDVAHLAEAERRFRLSSSDIALLNPNTRTCPIFRTRRDAEITKGVYQRVPVLVREGPPEENPWGVSFLRMFDMANDSGLFRTHNQLASEGWELDGNMFRRGQDCWLPLYEAKMVHHFDHRYGDYRDQPEGSENTSLPDVPPSRLADPSYSPHPRYWVPEREVENRLQDRWDRGWLLGWRDICRSTDERTVIAAVIPRVAVGHQMPLAIPGATQRPYSSCFLANASSFVFDFTARQKFTGHLTYFVLKQLPMQSPQRFDIPAPWDRTCAVSVWVANRVLELAFTAWGLEPFARDLGYEGPPFCWNPQRRFFIRCELDAAFFHLYGVSRDDAAYVLDMFPIVRRRDEAAHGEYRTKRVILERYDAMQLAIDSGDSYQTPLIPAPGDLAAPHDVARGPRGASQ
jgi:hypothetical protein